MDLNLIWFILIGALLAGYAMLDGFDLGVGIISPVLGGPRERNVAIKAIGPLWDGNEVWLVTLGGALFAAFPEAYATILSGLYLPVVLLLFALILRAVSIDFRNKIEAPFWKSVWDVGFCFSSLLATLVMGIAVGNIIGGWDLDERGVYQGSIQDLLGTYPLVVGLLAVSTFAMHGVIFLYLKTLGAVRDKLEDWMWHTWGIYLVIYVLVSMMTLVEHHHVIANAKQMPWMIGIVIVNVLAVANIPRAIYQSKYGQAFASSCANILCLVTLFCASVFPNLVVSTSDAPSLTIYNAASSESTLWLMLIMAMIGVPLIASYTVIIYWTFRRPVDVDT
jgi:cytochrome d ubiquinol oxidase subunit II